MLNVNFHQKGRKVMDRCVMAFVRHKREGTEVTLLNLINSAGACRSTFKGRVHLQHLTRWIIPPSLTWGGSKQWSCYDHIKFDMLTITGVMQERALKPGNKTAIFTSSSIVSKSIALLNGLLVRCWKLDWRLTRA